MEQKIQALVSVLSPVAKFIGRDSFVGIITAAARIAAEQIWDRANPDAKAESQPATK